MKAGLLMIDEIFIFPKKLFAPVPPLASPIRKRDDVVSTLQSSKVLHIDIANIRTNLYGVKINKRTINNKRANMKSSEVPGFNEKVHFL